MIKYFLHQIYLLTRLLYLVLVNLFNILIRSSNFFFTYLQLFRFLFHLRKREDNIFFKPKTYHFNIKTFLWGPLFNQFLTSYSQYVSMQMKGSTIINVLGTNSTTIPWSWGQIVFAHTGHMMGFWGVGVGGSVQRVPDTRPEPEIFFNTRSIPDLFSKSSGISGIGYYRKSCVLT